MRCRKIFQVVYVNISRLIYNVELMISVFATTKATEFKKVPLN